MICYIFAILSIHICRGNPRVCARWTLREYCPWKLLHPSGSNQVELNVVFVLNTLNISIRYETVYIGLVWST